MSPNIARWVAVFLVAIAGTDCKAAPRDAPAAPRIACENPSYDFGAALAGDRPAHRFEIENRGSAPLLVSQVDQGYNCVAAFAGAREVGPGAALGLDVTCDLKNRQGRLQDVLTVHSNDGRAPRLPLRVEGVVEPLLTLEPSFVDLHAPFGSKASADVRVGGRLAGRAALGIERLEGIGLEASLVHGTDGGDAASLRLTLAGAQVANGMGRAFLTTGLAEVPELIVSYTWRVTGNLAVTPEAPLIDLRSPESKQIALQIRSSRPDFRLRSVDVVEGPLEARIEPSDGGGLYSVDVAVDERRMPASERGLFGRIVLVSNDQAEPKKTIPIFVFGRPSSPAASTGAP